MSATALAERLRSVTTDDAPETRGQAIKRRMLRLGFNQSTFAEETKVDRGAIGRALRDQPGTSSFTYDRLEAALDRLEHEAGYGGPDAVLSTEQGLIEFQVTGDFGVRVVVKGPIRNADVLEDQVARLIRDIRTAPSDGEDPSD